MEFIVIKRQSNSINKDKCKIILFFSSDIYFKFNKIILLVFLNCLKHNGQLILNRESIIIVRIFNNRAKMNV